MKKLLLASVMVVGLCGSALADVPTFDASNALGQVKALAQELKGYLLQAQQYTTALQQYYAEAQMLAGLVHNPAGEIGAVLNLTGLGQDLPVSPMALLSLTQGFGGAGGLPGIMGKLSLLNGLTAGAYNSSHLTDCVDKSYTCAEQNSQEWGLAGTKGTLATLYSDLQSHISTMQALRGQLADAGDPKAVADLSAAVQTEGAYVQNLTGQATVIGLLADQQQRTASSLADQRMRADMTAFLASAPK
jgi:hypothetical protein